LKENGQLYYGSEDFLWGFDSVFIWSLNLNLLPDHFLAYLHIALVIVWLLAGARIIISKEYSSSLARMWYLVSLLYVALLFEHFVFGALYPLNRTFLYAWPLLVLLTGAVLQAYLIYFRKMKRIFISLFFLVFTCPLVYQFIQRMNVSVVAEWSYDAGTREAAQLMAGQATGKNLEIGNNWVFEPALQYYIITKKYPLELHKFDGAIPAEVEVVYDYCGKKRIEEQGWHSFQVLKGGATCLYTRTIHTTP
jgi:hypothetical protein